MIWKYIERLTTLSFLLLAVVLTVKLTNNNVTDNRLEAFTLEVSSMKAEIRRVQDANLYYLEGKANKIAEQQDSYQVSTSSRLFIVEERLRSLEKENKALKLQTKQIITNTNTANAIVNGGTKQ